MKDAPYATRPPTKRSQRREKIVEQCFPFFPTAMDEDTEIPQLLRHFMGSGGNPGADTDSDVTEKRPGDASFSAADGASALIAFASASGIRKGGGCPGFPEPSGNHTFRRIANCYSCVVELKFIEVVSRVGNVIAAQTESKVFIILVCGSRKLSPACLK